MKFDRHTPCHNCPFRKGDKAVRLLEGRAKEIVDQPQVFPCHKTIDYSRESGGRQTTETRACAGFMVYHMKVNGRPNDNMQIAERLGLCDIDDYDTPTNREAVVDSMDEMVE